MKIYLAAQYHQKEEIAAKAAQLADMGHKITSTWFTEPEKPTVTMAEVATETLIEYAKRDLKEIQQANCFILFTVDPLVPTKRGGRHFESGFAFANYMWARNDKYFGRAEHFCAIVGPRENIFHQLPQIKQFPTWEEAVDWLKQTP